MGRLNSAHLAWTLVVALATVVGGLNLFVVQTMLTVTVELERRLDALESVCR